MRWSTGSRRIAGTPMHCRGHCRKTRRDPVLSRVLEYLLTGWPNHVDKNLQMYFTKRDELSTEQGCLLWGVTSGNSIYLSSNDIRVTTYRTQWHQPNQSVCKKLNLVAWNECCYREYGAEIYCMSVSEESTCCGTTAPMAMAHTNMTENLH